MNSQFRLFQRSTGIFYLEHTRTRRQESLKTRCKETAHRLWHAKNEALLQPTVNLQIARAYLTASDPTLRTRTWGDALGVLIDSKHGSTRERWVRASKDKALDHLRSRVLIDTQAEHLLDAVKRGTVSTNVHLRKLHNFCVDLNWIPWPILAKKQWPAIRYGEKRAITREEHERVIGIEWDPERKAYYELLWHLGGSQSDVARLQAEAIDWNAKTIAYARAKTSVVSMLHYSEAVEQILRRLPAKGPFFPRIAQMQEKDRATEFKRRCVRLKIEGVTLHSYRYAWAERAKQAGYPERFAQEALGHNSKAIHRAYSRNAVMKVPSLEEYEKQMLKR
jgi:integrase